MAVTTALCRCWCKSGQCCPILFQEDYRNVNSIYLIQFKSKMNCPISSPWWIWGQPYKITSPWRLYPCIGKWWEQDKWEESVVFTKELAANGSSITVSCNLYFTSIQRLGIWDSSEELSPRHKHCSLCICYCVPLTTASPSPLLGTDITWPPLLVM